MNEKNMYSDIEFKYHRPFYARFVGTTEKFCNITIRKRELYRVEFLHKSSNGWLWFRFFPVDQLAQSRIKNLMNAIIGRGYMNYGGCVEIPYSSIDTFLDNWNVFFDANGNVVYE